MIYFLAGMFTLALIFGIWVLSYYFRKRKTNKKVVFVHGLFGGAGLMCFIIYLSLSTSIPSAIPPFFILLIAAFFGTVLFVYDIMHKRSPQWLWILHSILAISGVIVLYIAIFNK